MAVRSTRLGLFETGAGLSTIYTVPSGRRTIVRTIMFWNSTSAGILIGCTLERSGHDYGTLQYTLPAFATFWMNEWLVMHEGEDLKSYAAATGVTVGAWGSELVT